MEIVYTDKAIKDIGHWKQVRNLKIQTRISELISSIELTPFSGIGKPEPLRYNLNGLWSRRIDKENRIVYEVFSDCVVIHSLKGHY